MLELREKLLNLKSELLKLHAPDYDIELSLAGYAKGYSESRGIPFPVDNADTKIFFKQISV